MGEPIKIWGVAPMVLHKGPFGTDEWTCLIHDRYPALFESIAWDTQSKADGSPAGAQLALFHGTCDPAFALDVRGEKDVILLSDPRATADLAARLADPTGLQTKLIAAGVSAGHFEAKASPVLLDAINATWRTIYGKRLTDQRVMAPPPMRSGTITDDFTGNDNDYINGRALSGGGGKTWAGDATHCIISGNRARTVTPQNYSLFYVLNPAVNWQDCYVQIDAYLYRTGVTGGSLAFRWIDTNNQYNTGDYYDGSVSRIRVYKKVAGAETQLCNISSGVGIPVTIRCEVAGIDPGVISVYANGVFKSSFNGDNAFDSGNVGFHGVYTPGYYNEYDNFEANGTEPAGGYTVPLAHILEAAA